MRFLCGVPKPTPNAAWVQMVLEPCGSHLLQMAYSGQAIRTLPADHAPYCPIPSLELNEAGLWGEDCTGSHGACFQSSPPSLVASSGVLRWDYLAPGPG